jgi:hypothetical protein
VGFLFFRERERERAVDGDGERKRRVWREKEGEREEKNSKKKREKESLNCLFFCVTFFVFFLERRLSIPSSCFGEKRGRKRDSPSTFCLDKQQQKTKTKTKKTLEGAFENGT